MVARGTQVVLIGREKLFCGKIQEILENISIEYQVVLLDDVASLLEHVQTNLPYVVLVCQEESDDSLLDYLRKYRQLVLSLPLILIAPPLGEERVIAYMREGIADFLRPDNLEETLPPALERALRGSALKATREEVEQGLQLNYHHLRNLLCMTPVGVFRCDAEKNCIYVNERFCKITGLSPEEAMGKGWHQAVHPEDQEAVVDNWYGKKGVEEEIKAIYRYRKPKSGKTSWVIGQIISETDRRGKVVGYLGSITDISRLKEIEEALQEKNENLEKINQELDNFVYSASHNLRAPLTSLMGLINLIRMEAENPEVLQRICDMMDLSLNKLDSFIRDILDHSRNARLLVQAQETDAEALIREILEEFYVQEDISQIKVSTNIRQQVSFCTDSFRLRIVLRNLISNCIRYKSMSEPPVIRVEGEVDQSQARFRISDNGSGIRQEHQQKVFDMFYRADETRSGSGLGLYIAREVVEKMGGSIRLTSQPGKGTEVAICIPNNPRAMMEDSLSASDPAERAD